MIEINLVPDVKQELIRARRARTVVVSSAIIVGVATVCVVILLALYYYGAQTFRSRLADDQIAKASKELADVKDLDSMLTIQHQLSRLSEIHEQTDMDSRFFDLLTAINPAAPNQVSFSLARLDAEAKTIRLEGQAANGYIAADVLKKTIQGTAISYKDDGGSTKTVPLTDVVSTSEQSYGEDSTGKKVLRFTLTFAYADEFFARSSENAIIVRPDRQNVTDSYLRLPESLFGDRATSRGNE